MKIRVIAATLAAIIFVGWSWAGAEETNQPPPGLRLELDLVDGSHIIGIPKIESVPVQTSYAKVDIPLKQIASVKLADDHETASLDFVNGDKLKGAINLKPLELTTVFGPVKIAIEHLREIVVSSGEGLSGILARGLVLYYPFDQDEGGKVTDKSGKENHGISRGALWVAREGGGAYSFDGRTGYIETPHSASLNITKQITIASWVMLRGTPPWAWWPALVEKRDDAHPGGYALLQCSQDSKVKMEFCGGPKVAVDSAMPLPLNTWHHVAGTYDGEKIRIYVDGELSQTSDDTQGDLSACSTSVFIGRRRCEAVFLNACLRELMIFDRALSAAEIKKIHNGQRGR